MRRALPWSRKGARCSSRADAKRIQDGCHAEEEYNMPSTPGLRPNSQILDISIISFR